MGGGADKRLVVRKREELGEEGRNLESKRGRGDRRRKGGTGRGGREEEEEGGRWEGEGRREMELGKEARRGGGEKSRE